MTITPLPTPPSRSDPEATFVVRANDFLGALPDFATQANALAAQVNADKIAAETAAALAPAAIAAVNFQGEWSGLSGEISVPASVLHVGRFWVLLENLADITSEEPGASAAWASIPFPEDPELIGDIFFNGAFRGKTQAVTASIDPALSNYFTRSINSNATFTFGAAPSGAYAFTLRLTVSGSRTITWPASVRWPDGAAPSLDPSRTHLFVFVTDNGGTTWRGGFSTNYEG